MDREFENRPRFTQDEMSEILETAARLDGVTAAPGEVSLDELTQIATELGISAEAVEQVVSGRAETARAEREQREAEEAEAREAARKKRVAWRGWRAHVASYIAVMTGLFLLSLITTGAVFGWWIYPAIGWGMGLGVHSLVMLFNAYDEDE